MIRRFALFSAVMLAACGAPEETGAGPAEAAETVNIYSARHYDSDDALYDAFEAATGIRVRVREANAAQLLETMKAEGAGSPADVVIASDAGALWRFQEAGLLQPVRSESLEAAIPARYRDPDGHWFGLAKRVRVIAYSPDRLTPDQVDDYADLADPALSGELCMRSSANIYNLSLMGELIDRWGEARAADWARRVVENFARPPQGGDTAQIESIAAGECSAALVNHYYWVRLSESPSARRSDLTERVVLSFPSQTDGGTHVNVTGAGVAAHAPNRDAALRFIEFLAGLEGQSMLVTETKEYPILNAAPLPAGLDALPEFTSSTLALETLGRNQTTAQILYDRAGWN